MAKITGPGKVLERNPADMERSGSVALGRIYPSGDSSPTTPPTPPARHSLERSEENYTKDPLAIQQPTLQLQE